MRDRLLLGLYLTAVVAVTTVHDPAALALALAAVLALAGRAGLRLLRRALLAVALFNGVVTATYVILATLEGRLSWHYVALVNLRVLLLATLTFLAVERIDPFRALAFSPSLTYLLTLAYSQSMVLRRSLEEFRLALRSRSPTPPGLRERYRHSAVTAGSLLQKALADAGETAQALRSRGFFDD